MNNHNRAPKHLCLREGGQPLPGAAPGPLAQGPMSSQFWGAVGQGVNEHVVQPIAKNLRDFNTEYPVVNQIAQVVNQPYNLAVGIPEVGGALAKGNYPAAGQAAVGMLPFGKFAQVGTATSRAIRHLSAGGPQNVRNVFQKARLVGHDAGAVEQAASLGEASYDQTTRAIK